MLWAKQSTAISTVVGPILDSAGAEYASAAIGDLSISKNGGTLTALASTATLTYIANGQYTLALRTTDFDTLGRVEITCNKSTYQMPTKEFMVVPATVYDVLVTNATNVTGGLIAATGTVSAASGYVGASGAAVNGTNVNTLSGHDPGATLASQTNITAGTITTTTNLTNLPAITANWITAAGITDGAITSAKFASGALDAVWSTATRSLTTFGSLAADVWSYATRILTAGTNIALAKGTGVTGFNDVSAATVQSSADAAITANALINAIAGYIDTEVAAIKAKTDNLPAAPAAVGDIPTVSQIWTTALTEAYRATGAAGTAAQLLNEIVAHLGDSSISGTTKTINNRAGSAVKTYTLDSATAPTSIAEAT